MNRLALIRETRKGKKEQDKADKKAKKIARQKLYLQMKTQARNGYNYAQVYEKDLAGIEDELKKGNIMVIHINDYKSGYSHVLLYWGEKTEEEVLMLYKNCSN